MVNRRNASNQSIVVKIYHHIITGLFSGSALLFCFNNYRDRDKTSTKYLKHEAK